MVKITVDTIWLLCFSPESVEMCTKLQLWSDPFTISAIPPSQNTSRSSPRVLFFSTSTSSNPEFLIPRTEGAAWSPVRRVPQLRPRVGDLPSVFHPEALFVRSLESGEVTQQSDGLQSAICQDDLIGRIDLWLCKTDTVKPYHSSGAQSVLNASTHVGVAAGCMLFLHHLCRRIKWRCAHKQINNERNHKVHLYFQCDGAF